MLIDITLKLTPELLKSAPEKDNPALAGHLGTHFDVMDKVFPLEYTRRRGILFDVSSIRDRDIEISDINSQDLEKDLFVLFRTGWSREVTYGSREYLPGIPSFPCSSLNCCLKRAFPSSLWTAAASAGEVNIPPWTSAARTGGYSWWKTFLAWRSFRKTPPSPPIPSPWLIPASRAFPAG